MIFKNMPSAKKANQIANKITSYSYELKGIIISNCKERNYNINLEEIEYSTYFYDLFFYSQVMHVKYSNLFINTTINTILITLEENLKKKGNNIQKGYLQRIYKNLSKSLFEIYAVFKEEGINEIQGVAAYYCKDELNLDEQTLEENEILIKLIADHFQKIINLPESEI